MKTTRTRMAIGASVLSAWLVAGCSGQDADAPQKVARVSDEPPARVTDPPDEPATTVPPTTAEAPATTRPPTTLAPTTAQQTTTSPAPVAAVDPCAVLGDGLAAAYATADLPTAGASLDALAVVVDELHTAAIEAPADVRSVMELVAQIYDVFQRDGMFAVERAGATGDPEIAALTDELVRRSHGAFFHPFGLGTAMTDLSQVCPDVSVDIGIDEMTVATDPFVRMREIVARLTELGHAEIATVYLPPGVLDLTDRDMTVSLSGLQAEYDDCRGDFNAAGFGDNAGCDTLLASCDARDLLACNDLYWASVPGSAYEQFAATCGHRTEFGGAGFGGFCDELG